jgi:hypothetical protein
VCRVGRLPGYRRQRALAPHPPANLGVGAPLAIPAGHAHAPASIVPVIGDLRSNRLVCLRRDRGSYRAFVSVDVVLDLCVTGAECEPRLVNDAGLCVCVCPFVTMVRAGGSGHRRGTRSPLCSSEKVPNHFFWFNLSFRIVLRSFLKLNGGDCLCFFIGVAGLYIVLSGSDEGSRAAQAASSWAEQTGESKRMDQELEPQVSHSENLYRVDLPALGFVVVVRFSMRLVIDTVISWSQFS